MIAHGEEYFFTYFYSDVDSLLDLGEEVPFPDAMRMPDVLAMWQSQNPTRRSDLERFDKREQAKYAFLKKLTKALHDAEVPLLLGTDAAVSGLFPGKSAYG